MQSMEGYDRKLTASETRDWHLELQDPSLSSNLAGDFELSRQHWNLVIVPEPSASLEAPTDGAYPQANYLSLRNQQNLAAAELKYEGGAESRANGDTENARGLFQEGLDLVPGHSDLTRAIQTLEEVPPAIKSVASTKATASQSRLQDAVWEKALLSGHTRPDAPAAEYDDYPLLSSPDPSDEPQTRRRLKGKKHHRKRKRRHRDNDPYTSSSTTSISSGEQRRRRRQRRRKKRSKRAKSKRADNESDDSLVVGHHRRAKRSKRKWKERGDTLNDDDNTEDSLRKDRDAESSESETAKIDSNATRMRKRRGSAVESHTNQNEHGQSCRTKLDDDTRKSSYEKGSSSNSIPSTSTVDSNVVRRRERRPNS